jgi:AcrR family transcriptional regulator
MARSTARAAARPAVARPGPNGALRAPLTREKVVRAAIELADRGGIDALSMRKLAEELGVEAMSLYHHVANKDDLLGGMLDAVIGEMDLPATSGTRGTRGKGAKGVSWQEAIRRGAIAYRSTLRQHPWARSVLSTPVSMRPARMRVMDWLLRHLREAGFSPELTFHAYHALDSHIIGSAAWAAGYSAFAQDRRAADMAEAAMRELPMAELVYLAEHIRQHVEGFGSGTSQFEFGLDLLLDGLERLRDQERAPRTPSAGIAT